VKLNIKVTEILQTRKASLSSRLQKCLQCNVTGSGGCRGCRVGVHSSHVQSTLSNNLIRTDSELLGPWQNAPRKATQMLRKIRIPNYFSRTRFSCSHMVVKPILYCTRKCGYKTGYMSTSFFLQSPRNVSSGEVPVLEHETFSKTLLNFLKECPRNTSHMHVRGYTRICMGLLEK